MADELFYVNGIDGETGGYLQDPMTSSQFIDYIRGQPINKPILEFLNNIWQSISKKHLGLPDGLRADDFRQSGWGIVFHTGEDPAVKKAFDPLIKHRKTQIGDDNLVRTFEYSGEQDWKAWLAKNGVSPGSVIPQLVPFYLLVVGSPQVIPFWFTRLLDVEYAVGRLHFDEISEYERYVGSVISYETSDSIPNKNEAVFFATRHENDQSTTLSADNLVIPLTEGIPEDGVIPAQEPVTEGTGFSLRKYCGESATRSALNEVFSPKDGDGTPSFLFTATYGIGYRKMSDEQYAKQGALVCQDRSDEDKFIPEDSFSAADLPAASALEGLISFNYACFSAGTPMYDQYLHIQGAGPRQIAERPFIAALPRAMLSHPNGGALACIGHIDKSWSSSFMVGQQRSLVVPFSNTIGRILTGKPVGYAVKDFNKRFAAYSAGLSERQQQLDWGLPVSETEFVKDWVLRNDAGGYAIIGDPAVSLRVDKLIP